MVSCLSMMLCPMAMPAAIILSHHRICGCPGIKRSLSDNGSVIVFWNPRRRTGRLKHYILEGGYMDEVDLMLTSHYGSDWGSEVTGKAILVWPTP